MIPAGIHKIKHVIIIEQENRSFDSYFGTFPGADGIPMRNGAPTVCVPNPAGGCTKPYHDTADVNGGGPHGRGERSGRRRRRSNERVHRTADTTPRRAVSIANDPACTNAATPDVMGYHTAAEIPNYWTYAKDFVLDDHMFEPVKSWSLPDHLYLVSGWSAKCSSRTPSSCRNQSRARTHRRRCSRRSTRPSHRHRGHHQCLDRHHLAPLQPSRPLGLLRPDRQPARLRQRLGRDLPADGAELPDPRDLEPVAPLRGRPEGPPAQEHPAPDYYFASAKAGTLPAVSWITPSQADSDTRRPACTRARRTSPPSSTPR